jgi:hypothetical protein
MVICSRVLRTAPSTEKPHEVQLAMSRWNSPGQSSPAPHAGQTMWPGMDVARDGTLIAVSLVGWRSFVGTHTYGTVLARVVL